MTTCGTCLQFRSRSPAGAGARGPPQDARGAADWAGRHALSGSNDNSLKLWDLDSGACALSELGTRPSVGPPTFSAVVGTVQPLLASEAQAFRWVEGGL